MARFVTLGPKAGCFRDSGMDIFIAPGEVITLNAVQINSPKVRRALQGGHLVFTEDPTKAKVSGNTKKDQDKKPQKPQYTPEELEEAFVDFASKEGAKGLITKNFTFDQLKVLADLHEILVEEGDKKADLVEALLEDYAQGNGE